jgi:hypothetical protein
MLMSLCPSRQAGLGGRGAPGAGRRAKLRGLNDLIKRTQHTPASAVEDVGINHRRGNVLVPEQFLHRADVIAGLQQVCGKRMPQSMRGWRAWRFPLSPRRF